MRKIVPQGAQVDALLQLRRLEERFRFRGKVQDAVLLVQVQRPLAEAVACDEQPVFAGVPDREGEGASHLLDRILVPVLVGAQQHFLGRLAGELEAVPEQALAQLRCVHDRAVEDQRDLRGAVAQRNAQHRLALAIALHVADLAGDAAMLERRQHRPDGVLVDRAARGRYPACDAGHGDEWIPVWLSPMPA
jgi:hypothetical protein